MKKNRLGTDAKGYRSDQPRLVLCRLTGLEFNRRFKDMLIRGVLSDGSGSDEEVHIMLSQADVEVLASFVASCQVRLRQFKGGPSLDVLPASIGGTARDRADLDRT